jgi:hypothetical protein
VACRVVHPWLDSFGVERSDQSISPRRFGCLPATPTGPPRKTKEASREQDQRARLRAWSKRSESTRYLPIDQGRATSMEALHMRTDHVHNRCCAGPEAPVAVTEVKANSTPIAGKIRAGWNRLVPADAPDCQWSPGRRFGESAEAVAMAQAVSKGPSRPATPGSHRLR